MSLSQQLLADLRAASGSVPKTFQAADGPRRVRCETTRCEKLAATIDALTLETAELAAVSVAQLEAASAALCRRVNYLLEPISPIETDAEGCTVQMRSNPPQRDDDGRRYYELMLRRGGAVELFRYEKPPGAARLRTTAVLTHEVVGRLVDDFSATVDGI
ncbi:MAG: hypothetical protein AAF961_14740 [Planctomycetota bacterium]